MTRAIPAAEIVHAIDGRTRLRLVAHAGDHAFFAALAERLIGLDGVHSVEARALTGSVLVIHEGDFGPIGRRAEAANLLAPVALASESAPAPSRTTALPAAGALVMGALGVFQLFQERVLPPATTLFWYAMTLAREAQAVQDDDGEDGDGD